MATSRTSAMSTGAEDRQKVWELIKGIHIATLMTQEALTGEPPNIGENRKVAF